MDNIKFDYTKFINICKKHYVILLLLIPIFLSIFLRSVPFYLPITDSWASDTINTNIKNSISLQIDNIYPNLPEYEKQQAINNEYNKYIKENSQAIKSQTLYISQQFKNAMQDNDGQTYLLAIDPYLWYGQSKNYLKYGQFGNTLNEDGRSFYSLRNGRVGVKTSIPFISFLTIVLYKIVSVFNNNFSLLSAAFYLPMLLVTLGIIPVYFICKRFTNDIGALFASIMYAIHPALLSRTTAGFSDTDPLVVVIPLFVAWLFIESFYVKKITYKYLLLIGTGTILGILSHAWGQGWWYSYDFIIATMGIYLLFSILRNFKSIKQNILSIFKLECIKDTSLILSIITLSFIIGSSIIGKLWYYLPLTNSLQYLKYALYDQPLWFINIKSVGETTIWPNVLTTVAELNASSLSTLISSVGGMVLFISAFIGIIFVMNKSKNTESSYFKFGVYFMLWFVASIFASLTSLRFIEIVIPIFSILLGITVGSIYTLLNKLSSSLMVNEKLLKIIIVCLFAAVFLSPITTAWQTAKNEIPSYTDTWDSLLKDIQYNSTDAIIASWWDFGHWFVSTSERRVIFDGGDQGLRVHFVGKILSTKNETEAINILQMLNCQQDKAYSILVEEFNWTEYDAINYAYNIISMNKSEAEKLNHVTFNNKTFENKYIEYTHCEDIIDQYVITSEDMVGKAGVWAHFGTWDFDRAVIYNNVRKIKSQDKAVDYIINNMNVSRQESTKIYSDIKIQSGDKWITDWPSYLSSEIGCIYDNNTAVCQSIEINLVNKTAKMFNGKNFDSFYSLVYIDNDTVVENINNIDNDISVAILPNNNIIVMHKDLSISIFTKLFFYNGLGLEHFKIFRDDTTFRGEDIKTWTVDLGDTQ